MKTKAEKRGFDIVLEIDLGAMFQQELWHRQIAIDASDMKGGIAQLTETRRQRKWIDQRKGCRAHRIRQMHIGIMAQQKRYQFNIITGTGHAKRSVTRLQQQENQQELSVNK
jgi:hypothetical protein